MTATVTASDARPSDTLAATVFQPVVRARIHFARCLRSDDFLSGYQRISFSAEREFKCLTAAIFAAYPERTEAISRATSPVLSAHRRADQRTRVTTGEASRPVDDAEPAIEPWGNDPITTEFKQ
ncbi:MAG: hypothetical protein K0U93_03330 [Gammaproteobacteria bacterium]|nr:hypothetical protein [Gammaproteobacteria bacterium]